MGSTIVDQKEDYSFFFTHFHIETLASHWKWLRSFTIFISCVIDWKWRHSLKQWGFFDFLIISGSVFPYHPCLLEGDGLSFPYCICHQYVSCFSIKRCDLEYIWKSWFHEHWKHLLCCNPLTVMPVPQLSLHICRLTLALSPQSFLKWSWHHYGFCGVSFILFQLWLKLDLNGVNMKCAYKGDHFILHVPVILLIYFYGTVGKSSFYTIHFFSVMHKL